VPFVAIKPAIVATTRVLALARSSFCRGIEVVAINTGGRTQPSASDANAPIALPQPFNIAFPQISGTARVGATLTASPGTWTGTPTSHVFQWYVCDDAVEQRVPIASATASTYAIVASDVPAARHAALRPRLGERETRRHGDARREADDGGHARAQPPARASASA
jgi:hypothetical protein